MYTKKTRSSSCCKMWFFQSCRFSLDCINSEDSTACTTTAVLTDHFYTHTWNTGWLRKRILMLKLRGHKVVPLFLTAHHTQPQKHTVVYILQYNSSSCSYSVLFFSISDSSFCFSRFLLQNTYYIHIIQDYWEQYMILIITTPEYFKFGRKNIRAT